MQNQRSLLAVLLTGAFPVAVMAAPPPLTFPETATEIIRALPKPQHTLLPACPPAIPDCEIKGLEEKGILKIATDAPKVGALIQFEYDSVTIRPDSHGLLAQYADALTTGLQNAVLLIAGHTDYKGTEEYNQTLSQQRAEAVKQFLVETHGIKAHQLRCVGFGESQPLRGTRAMQTDEDRSWNRRVEFIRTD